MVPVVVTNLFEDFSLPPQEEIEVAFVAWPQNTRMPGLLRLLQRAKKIIYVGCNTSGTACETPELFLWLFRRPVLGEVLHRRNCVTVYDNVSRLSEPRSPTLEEQGDLAVLRRCPQALQGLGERVDNLSGEGK